MNTKSPVNMALFALIFVLSLFALSKTTFQSTWTFMSSDKYFHEEVRTHSTYHTYADPELFTGDYVNGYMTYIGFGKAFDGLNYLAAQIFKDITVFHFYILPIFMWGLFLLSTFCVGYKIGRAPVAWAMLFLALSFVNIPYHFLSAKAQGFSFTFLMLTILALQYKSHWGLLALCLTSAAVYPPVAPIIGLSWAWYWLCMPRHLWSEAVQGRSFTWRFVILSIGGAATLALVYTALHKSGEFGALIGTDPENYPETGEGGRYFDGTLYPLDYAFRLFLKQTYWGIGETNKVIPLIFAGITLALSVFFLASKPKHDQAWLLKPFVGASVLCAVITLLVLPGLAYRFIHYPIYILCIVALPVFIHGLYKGYYKEFLIIGCAIIATLPLNKDILTVRSDDIFRIHPLQWEVIDFASTTPKDAVFAGWPNGTIDVIPYIAKRSAFFTFKMQYPVHDMYTLEMRKRSYAFYDAFFATNKAELVSFSKEWGVKYLIVYSEVLDTKEARHFKPFTAYIEKKIEQTPRAEIIVLDPPEESIAFKNEYFHVIDLTALKDQ